jgi:hypothetical protein
MADELGNMVSWRCLVVDEATRRFWYSWGDLSPPLLSLILDNFKLGKFTLPGVIPSLFPSKLTRLLLLYVAVTGRGTGVVVTV